MLLMTGSYCVDIALTHTVKVFREMLDPKEARRKTGALLFTFKASYRHADCEMHSHIKSRAKCCSTISLSIQQSTIPHIVHVTLLHCIRCDRNLLIWLLHIHKIKNVYQYFTLLNVYEVLSDDHR